MNLTLTIEAQSFEEIAHLFVGNKATVPGTSDAAKYMKAPGEQVQNLSAPRETAKEAEPEVEAPAKKSRGRKADGASKGTTESSSGSETTAQESPASGGTSPTATSDASPSNEKVTFEDLRAAASPLMEAGKSREIQEMLFEKFGVRAFGPLKEDQYADCLGELQSLAA